MYTLPNRPDKSIILLGFLVAVDDTRGMSSRQPYQSYAVVAVLEPPVEDFIICYNLIGHVSQEINWLINITQSSRQETRPNPNLTLTLRISSICGGFAPTPPRILILKGMGAGPQTPLTGSPVCRLESSRLNPKRTFTSHGNFSDSSPSMENYTTWSY